MNFKRSRGFTLVEILITVAIIGLLSSITLGLLDMAKKKGRDSRRISDIKQINGAIENYFSVCYEFPEELADIQDPTACEAFDPVLPILPKDPLTGNEYGYYTDSLGSANDSAKRFHLCATLEDSFGDNKGKAGIEPFDGVGGEDECDGIDEFIFDVVGGAY